MKKFLFSALAVAMGLNANAESDMYLQMDDQNDLSYVKVSLIVENDLQKYIEGLDAHILLPSPLTKDNFVEDEDKEVYFVATSKGDEQNLSRKIDNTNGTLWISYTTNARSKKQGHIQGGPGKIDLGYFHFNASSLETGDYELLINSNDPAYNSFVSVTDMVDGAYGTTYHTEILGHKSSLKFHVDKTEGTIKAVPTYAKVDIYQSGTSAKYDYDWDISQKFVPVKNQLLITEDPRVQGNNVILKTGENYSCKSLVIDDAVNGIYSPVNFTAEKVTYNRTTSGKEIVTMCLPFEVPVDKVNGVPARLVGFDGKDLTFEKLTSGKTEANTPYLVANVTDGQLILEVENTNVKATIDPLYASADGADFVGSVKQTWNQVKGTYDWYAFIDNVFYRVANLTVPQFRAAIRLLAKTDISGNQIKSDNLSQLGIKFVGEDEPTGADVVEVETEAGKVNVFDPLGRAVRLNVEADKATEGLKDGIYIVNGQKVIVKNK